MASGTLSNNNVDVSNNNPTLSWGGRAVIGTVNGQELSVNMPANPDTHVTVVNNLTSSSTTAALSAYQGNVLNYAVSALQQPNNGNSVGGVYFYRVGRIIYATISEGTMTSNLASGATLATAPVGYRPTRVCIAMGMCTIPNVGTQAVRLHINYNGTITYPGDLGTIPSGSTIRLSTCYIAQ